MLINDIAAGDDHAFAAKLQAFLSLCARLQAGHRAGALVALLQRIHRLRYADAHPFFLSPDEHGPHLSRRDVLVAGVHACLQALPMDALFARDAARLYGWATILPSLLPDDEKADSMAISLLRMMPANDEAAYRWHEPDGLTSLYHCVRDMLEQIFGRGPRQSVSRFGFLYQAMAHLLPYHQFEWMRAIVTRCATQVKAGMTPALIVATAQAALRLPGYELDSLYNLFAFGLNPGVPREAYVHPFLQAEVIASSGHADYARSFDANCRDLVHALEDAPPEVAAKLLAGINSAYVEALPLSDVLPAPDQFKEELYGYFLEHALAFLQGLPPACAADCLLQWRLPQLHALDARIVDDRAIALLAALEAVGHDNSLASPERLGTALAAVMKQAVNVGDHSPLRNRRLLAALAGFPDALCAQVLSHLLADRDMGLAHVDVLLADIVEAAARLPDALRAEVLAIAADQLPRFPEARRLYPTDLPTLREQRDRHFDYAHPGLQASDPALYAYIRPGGISRTAGFALLIDAMETLPPRYRPELLQKLGASKQFFTFSNNCLSMEEKAQCSIRLLSAVIGLPNDLRNKPFSSWLEHVARQFYEGKARAAIEDALLPLLFALPATDGKLLFNAYVATVGSAPEKTALLQRAEANWKDTT